MRAIALVDLDDTLFQTLGKCPPDVPRDRLTPLGFARDGTPLSFATPRQMRFLDWLSETSLLVPVTGRSLDALRRARIRCAAAVCAHGAVMLDAEGRVDAEWAAEMELGAERHAGTLEDLANAISVEADRTAVPIHARVLTEDGMPVYVLAKHANGDAAALRRVVDAAVPEIPAGWTPHANGNNAALLPPHVGKRQAVARMLPRLRTEHPDAPVVGVGDSSTDAPFMSLCDYAMMPTGSQLADGVLGVA